MGTRSIARLIAVVATAVFALPVAATPAAPLRGDIVQCTGVTTVNSGEARCEARFMIEPGQSRFPSDIRSHANFHARTAAGTVTVDWYDQLFHLMARITCASPGLYVEHATPSGHTIGAGPADLSTYPNCQRTFSQSAKFATGPQLLVVRATANACLSNDNSTARCPFHGYLVLSQPPWPV